VSWLSGKLWSAAHPREDDVAVAVGVAVARRPHNRAAISQSQYHRAGQSGPTSGSSKQGNTPLLSSSQAGLSSSSGQLSQTAQCTRNRWQGYPHESDDIDKQGRTVQVEKRTCRLSREMRRREEGSVGSDMETVDGSCREDRRRRTRYPDRFLASLHGTQPPLPSAWRTQPCLA